MRRWCDIQTPLGEMIAMAEEDVLCGLWFSGQKHEPDVCSILPVDSDFALFRELQGQLAAYFAGKLQDFKLSLAPQGTSFQLAVWALLRNIPFGATTTYGALARELALLRHGCPPAAQAVGGAVGRNPLTIIVPCHRVIGSDGSMTGYAGGLERKGALLALEGSFRWQEKGI